MKRYKTTLNTVIHVPIYRVDVMVLIGHEPDHAVKVLNTKNESGSFIEQMASINAKGLTIRDDQCRTLIWVRDQLIAPSVKGTLAHEIFHAATFILDNAGIKHCDDSTEAWAYLIGYLTQEIYLQL